MLGRSQKHSIRSIMGFALIITMIVATSGVISGLSVQIFGITQKAGNSPSILITIREQSARFSDEVIPLLNHTNIKSILPFNEQGIALVSELGLIHSRLFAVNFTQLMDYYSNAELVVGRLPQNGAGLCESIVGLDFQQYISGVNFTLFDSTSGFHFNITITGFMRNIGEMENAFIIDQTEFMKIYFPNSTSISFQKIKIRLKNGNFVHETISDLERALSILNLNINIIPEQQADIFTSSLFSDIISQLNILYFVLFIIALFRLYHSTLWFVRKYERDFLIMRTVGLSSYQLTSLIVFMTFFITNAGFFLGFYFGNLVSPLILAILALFFNSTYVIPEYNLLDILPLFILSNFTGLLAAFFPAIDLSKKALNSLAQDTYGLEK